MPPLFRFLIHRLFSIPVTLFIITLTLYGIVMLTPPEARASLYIPKGVNLDRMTPEQIKALTEKIISRYHLRDPFPVQYGYWAVNLIRGDWGYSPVLNDDVLSALLKRTPVTAELTLFALLFFIPLGLISGVIAGSHKNRSPDLGFRFTAFTGTSLPPFILALVLLSFFYVALHWFPPERLGVTSDQWVKSNEFISYTGLLTIDGLLNHRPDISLEAARHLVLPVLTLSLIHWATLGRVTRASMIEELQKEYIVAGKARGISDRGLVWKHALRNSMTPALTSSILSVASLFTGVFVVEVIFNFKGISDIVVESTRGAPDASAVLGFAIYSVLIVLILMLVLDILQTVLDPRLRKGILEQ